MTPEPSEHRQQVGCAETRSAETRSAETRSAETRDVRSDAVTRRPVRGPDPEATKVFLAELREATKAARTWPEWKRRVFHV